MPEIGGGKIFLGIDPGLSGGLACLRGNRLEAVKMPATEQDVWDWVNNVRKLVAMWDSTLCFAVLEKVSGYIGEKQPGSAMFKFGASFGGLNMALTAAGVPYELVTPQRWQKGLALGTRKKGEAKNSWKQRLRAVAQKLFPGVAISLQVADAVLLCVYAKRLDEGKVQ